jgi:hypothetical protein
MKFVQLTSPDITAIVSAYAEKYCHVPPEEYQFIEEMLKIGSWRPKNETYDETTRRARRQATYVRRNGEWTENDLVLTDLFYPPL